MEPRRFDLSQRRHAALDAALRESPEAAARVLRRFRREALRYGDVEEAADCLGVLWFLSLQSPQRQLRLARARVKEAPSTPSLVNLGHALVICDRIRAARRAYERAIEVAATGAKSLRKLDAALAKEAKQAIECLDSGRPIPFVEGVRKAGRQSKRRPEAEYERCKRLVREAPSASAFQMLGIATEQLGRGGEALQAYKKAAKLARSAGDDGVHESLLHKIKSLRRTADAPVARKRSRRRRSPTTRTPAP